MHFCVWFKRTFKVDVPQEFYDHLKTFSDGIYGDNYVLYKESEIITRTENGDSILGKGFCIVGHWNKDIIILRAKDGKVFMVDSKDLSRVAAWFCNISMFRNLCQPNIE